VRRGGHTCRDWHAPCSIRAQFESYLTPQRKWRGNLLVTLPVHPGASRKIRPPAFQLGNRDSGFAIIISAYRALIVPTVLTTLGGRA